MFDNPEINLHQEFVTSANIVNLFQKYGVPFEPDYVSIDIDSADLWVMKSIMGSYRPRVVSIEYNSNYGGFDGSLAHIDPSIMPTNDYAPPAFPYTCFYGSSAASIHAAASREHHYKLVGAVHGLDLVFVRGDLWPFDPMPLDKVTDRREVHAPMTIQQARGLIDYDIWTAGGTLCEAKKSASLLIRSIARSSGPCNCTSVVRTAPCVCGCFANLVDISVPDCPNRPAPSVGTSSFVEVGGLWSEAVMYLPDALKPYINWHWFLTKHEEGLDEFKIAQDKGELSWDPSGPETIEL